MKCECFVYVIEWYRFFFRIISLYICIRIDYLKNKKTIKCAFLVIYCLSLFIYCRHEVMYTKYDIMAGSSEVSHNVHNLQPGIEYLFVVTATNQAGEGEMSNSRSAKTFNAGVIWLHVFNTLLLSKTLHFTLCIYMYMYNDPICFSIFLKIYFTISRPLQPKKCTFKWCTALLTHCKLGNSADNQWNYSEVSNMVSDCPFKQA